jgi:hypothetical protein
MNRGGVGDVGVALNIGCDLAANPQFRIEVNGRCLCHLRINQPPVPVLPAEERIPVCGKPSDILMPVLPLSLRTVHAVGS